MLFGWLRSRKEALAPEPVKKLSRKAASDEWVKYGEDLANENRIDEALDCFNKAIETYPQNDLAHGDMGLILDKKGNASEALESFSKALALNSSNPITWHNKGLVLIKMKKLVEAIDFFERAIEHDQNYAKAWYNKARALSLLGKTDDSQRCFDIARKLDPLLFTKLKKMK
jgi:tetratricopeptide (TPR) repeat protein